METRLLTQNEFLDIKNKIPESSIVIYFEITGVGPKTILSCEQESSKIHEIVSRQSGFYLIGDNEEDLKLSFHDFVNKFFEARKNNGK